MFDDSFEYELQKNASFGVDVLKHSGKFTYDVGKSFMEFANRKPVSALATAGLIIGAKYGFTAKASESGANITGVAAGVAGASVLGGLGYGVKRLLTR